MEFHEGFTPGIPSECWEWQGKTEDRSSNPQKRGYGRFYDKHGKRNIRTHRYAYEQQHGPVPQGLEIDHLCDNPPCVNPKHLKAVTHSNNWKRTHILRKYILPLVHALFP